MNFHLKSLKIGFLGAGHMAQAMIKGLLESGLDAQKIYVSNRTPGKLQKLSEHHHVQICNSNEELVEKVDVVIIAVKPQDLLAAIEPISQAFLEKQIVISLAAGLRMDTLEKHLPQCRLVRLMPNTPTLISKGLLGYLANDNEDEALKTIVEDMCSPLGSVFEMQDEDQFEAFMIACSSGTGFVFELMLYWQEWMEEYGFEPEVAQKMTIETFLGAALLAAKSPDLRLEELQARVTSKKGVTAAGLESMRELEIERALRLSFEKASLRNKEMSRLIK